MNILGLDLSTSCVGSAVVDESTHDLLAYQATKLTSKKFERNLYKKSTKISDVLSCLNHEHPFDRIFIEGALKSFSGGKSSAQTLATAARFNGMISLLCFRMFGIEPELIEPKTARKLNGLRIPRGQKPKPIVFDYVVGKYPEIVVDYKTSGNTNEPRTYMYDIADAVIIALAGINIYERGRNS